MQISLMLTFPTLADCPPSPQEVRPRTPASEQKLKTLECFALLATKSKTNTEKALGRLMDMATNQVHVTVT